MAGITQSGAILFNLGDHDLPQFQSIFRLSYFEPLCKSSKRLFMLFSPAAISFSHSSCHEMFLFLSSNHMPKNLPILFMSDVVSASRNTISFDIFAVHKIHRILCRNHISVTSRRVKTDMTGIPTLKTLL